MGKKILVIDDDINLARSIQTFLECNGYKVKYISDGIAGLDVIRKEKPDLILTDLLLPRLHGFDFCKIVKDDARLKNIPLIVMTAVYRNSIHKLEARNMGVDEYLEKPLNFNHLLNKIEQLLDIPNPGLSRLDSAQQQEADDTLEKQFEAIQKDFASGLFEKISELENAWSSVENRKDTVTQLARFRRVAHNLAGSGPNFGFKELSENARQLELLADMIIAEGEHTVEERKDQINMLLDNMRHDPLIATEIEVAGKTYDLPY
ncbi:MAG: response regulator [Candidatus Omnitrophota bacterium]